VGPADCDPGWKSAPRVTELIGGKNNFLVALKKVKTWSFHP